MRVRIEAVHDNCPIPEVPVVISLQDRLGAQKKQPQRDADRGDEEQVRRAASSVAQRDDYDTVERARGEAENDESDDGPLCRRDAVAESRREAEEQRVESDEREACRLPTTTEQPRRTLRHGASLSAVLFRAKTRWLARQRASCDGLFHFLVFDLGTSLRISEMASSGRMWKPFHATLPSGPMMTVQGVPRVRY